MKKVLKIIPIFLTAILFAVFFVPLTKNVTLASADYEQGSTSSSIAGSKSFDQKAMHLEYADDVLVGVDNQGSVWRAESGNVKDLTKTGITLKFDNQPEDIVSLYPGENKSSVIGTKLLAYGANTLMFLGNRSDSNGIEVMLYKSTDRGLTWTYTSKHYDKTANPYPYYIEFVNDHFVFKMYQSGSDYYWKTIDGESWTFLGNFCCNANKECKTTTTANDMIFQTVSQSGYGYIKVEGISEIYLEAQKNTWVEFKKIYIEKDADISAQTIYYKNAYYVFASDGRVWRTPDENTEWTLLGNIGSKKTINVVPFEDGLAVCCSSCIKKIKIINDELNVENLFDSYYASYGIADTFVFSDNFTTFGVSNVFSVQPEIEEDSYDQPTNPYAYFQTKKRSKIRYVVEFKNYDGSTISEIEVRKGNLPTVPANPSRVEYRFTGWDKDTTAPITEDTVFTAQFEILKFNIVFKNPDGSILKTLQVNYGEYIPEAEIPSPSKEVYVFESWDKDTSKKITSDITFTAQYTQNVYLTFKFRKADGTMGLIDQFKKTSIASYSIEYKIGDTTNNEQLQSFLASISDWTNDKEDGWDYDYEFLGWNEEIPSNILENTTITANVSKLNLVRLEYYSFLNFAIEEDSNYYNTFVGYMKIEKLYRTGEKINIEDFKRSDIDYEVWSGMQGAWYNNIVGFNFTGWDRDISEPITEDTVIKANYDMPTFNIKYYDADNYLIDETNEQIQFLGFDQLIQIINNNQEDADQFKSLIKNFFTFKWGKIADQLAQRLDVYEYLAKVNYYNDLSTQLLTAFIVIDSDRPGIYDGFFTDGTISVNSSVLKKYAGSQESHNMSYWISPIMFSTQAYPMSATVTYKNVLNSAIKTTKKILSSIGSIISSVWNFWKKAILIVLIVAAVIFFIWLFKTPIKKVLQKFDQKKDKNKKIKEQYKNSKKNKH